jgi:hypothetical protein
MNTSSSPIASNAGQIDASNIAIPGAQSDPKSLAFGLNPQLSQLVRPTNLSLSSSFRKKERVFHTATTEVFYA